MDYTGLVFKYRVNRRLTNEEVNSKLDTKFRQEVKPLDQICVIKINSTYLESVDKYYGYKGFQTLFMGLVSVGTSIALVLFSKLILFDQWPTLPSEKKLGAFFAWLISFLIFGFFSFLSTKLLLKESFAYTHYPIRLNRKNRMVYVFRTNGSVLSVPWDEVFFAIEYEGSRLGNIKGHVLDKDGKTVMETFAFSAVSTSREILLGHWEFLRRYMEEGPEAAFEEIHYCMPVDGKYESFNSGMERTFANDFGAFPGSGLILWPLNFITSLARYFSMRTSKIPVWPAEVEEACKVDPDDPWVKDSRINPPDLR